MDAGERGLLQSFKTSVFDNFIDLSKDLIELPIDKIIDNTLLRDIPIIGTLVGIGRSSIAIRDLHLLKKTLAFTAKVNDGTVSKKQLNKHREKLEKDRKVMNRELEYLIVMLDHFNESKKAFILGNIYVKYIDEDVRFDWNDFCIFAEILERFSVYDFQTLIELYSKKAIKYGENYNKLALSRIDSLGLINFLSGIRLYSKREEFVAKINELGELFVEMAFLDKEGNITPVDVEG